MNKEFYIAFCLSAAVHAAVVGASPSLHKETAGESGDKQDIVVLGVIEFTPQEQKEPEILERNQDVQQQPEHVLGTTRPAPVDDPEPLRADQVAMVQPEKPPEAELSPSAKTMMPGKQVLSQGQNEDIRSRYLREVMQKLEKAKRYPPYAWRHGIEGTVEIEFTIEANGHASDIILHRSSRYQDLNTAAQDLVTRASPFSPIPGELDQERMTISVPIAFQIKTP